MLHLKCSLCWLPLPREFQFAVASLVAAKVLLVVLDFYHCNDNNEDNEYRKNSDVKRLHV